MKNSIMKMLAGASLLALAAFGAVPAGAATLANGGFLGTPTNPAPGGAFETLFANGATSTAISGWTVVAGSVDWINTYWTAPNNSLSIDMNGNGPGAIRSDPFATTVGMTYVVQFQMSGNSDSGCAPYDPPSTKSVSLGEGEGYTFASYSTRDQVFPTGQSGKSTWETQTHAFTARYTSTSLVFIADPTNTTPCGPVIADVSVTEVATTGAQCKNGGWETLANPSTLLMFKNQGACVSYFATAGDVPIGSGS